MNVRDSRVHNYPPRWNAAPSQDLLVIRRNHKTGEVSLDPFRWGLIPYWCKDAIAATRRNPERLRVGLLLSRWNDGRQSS
jgi:putative SOS response-associated peptidase YedK